MVLPHGVRERLLLRDVDVRLLPRDEMLLLRCDDGERELLDSESDDDWFLFLAMSTTSTTPYK